MYYNARWYDPGISEFTSPDTIIPNLYNSADWNRYGYARYNPLRYTDPSGHCSTEGDDWCYDQPFPPTLTPTPTSTSTLTPTPTPSYVQASMSLLQQFSTTTYNAIKANGIQVSEGSGCGGSSSAGKIVLPSSACHSPAYAAGTLEHEYTHHQFTLNFTIHNGSLLQEYIANLRGDIVRATLVTAGLGKPTDMKYPLSYYTVDIENPNNRQLSADLYNWFYNKKNERDYIVKYRLPPLPY